MSLSSINPPAVAVRQFPRRMWNMTWQPAKTHLTDGYHLITVSGGSDGDALYVFNGGCMIDLDRSVRTHDAAVAYCTDHFDELVNGKAVAA